VLGEHTETIELTFTIYAYDIGRAILCLRGLPTTKPLEFWGWISKKIDYRWVS